MSEADAPGKLVIAGEYAVLHGAPAIAIAVNVRARARVARAAESPCLVVAEAGSWRFGWQVDGRLQWQARPDAGQGTVFEAVLAALSRRGRLPAPLPPLVVELDTRDFHRERADGFREKLGLGSSAAVTAALAGALLAELGEPTDTAMLLELCLDAHRELQGGLGSGIDVMAAVHGGVVGIGGPEAPGRVLPLAWPEGLQWLAVWSGRAASTTVMLERFAAFRAAQPDEFRRQLSRLQVLAEASLQAWRHEPVTAVLAALADYGAALRGLDAASGIGIWTPVHERLASLAGEAGAVYKTSGAGGGDFGMAFSSTAEPLERLQARLTAEGLYTMAGEQGAPGIAIGMSRPTRR